MIKVPYLQVLVKLNMSSTTVHSIAPHELPILQERHPGKVILHKVTEHTKKLDPETEYGRVKRLYGIDNKGEEATKRPWIELVYGRFAEGRFEKSMKAGAKHYLPKKKKKKAKSEEALTPQQKAARTRAANRLAKLEKEANAKVPESATG